MPSRRLRSAAVLAAILAGAAGVAGCAEQRQAGYYDPPRASTITDAQIMGTGADYRPVVRAPSQLQIDLKAPTPSQQQQQEAQRARAIQEGNTTEDGQPMPPTSTASADTGTGAATPAPAPSPSAAERSLVPQPQTYMGTLPCFAAGMECEAQRITLTLAPNGRWRGRSAYLDNASSREKPIAEQGCWQVTDEKPPRVFLIGPDNTTRAEFVVAANNVLRLRAIAGVTPNLNYTLTRQPDLDPINELAKQTPPKCP
ncbi:Lipoprotein [Bordetella sputigena]|uniref:copper resistance protein NlpE N-terminal domain-containing protein n=1 Tax=Bordetella sputigena TaxID=1416810 RepID=UPI0039F013CB